jgi:hypothetical protein
MIKTSKRRGACKNKTGATGNPIEIGNTEKEDAGMTTKQKDRVKQTARQLYQNRRISLEMAIWAMKNAGYNREETAEWLGLARQPME